MDILAYDYLLNGLKEYNEMQGKPYGNTIVSIPPNTPTYPLTVFHEVRNVADIKYNTNYGKMASVGFRVDIYAKTKGKIDKQTIARKVMQEVDEYFAFMNLIRSSFNVNVLENDSSIYHIILTYSGTLDEYRRRFI